MATYGHRGSFVGFTYNGIHSSTLGLTRVADKRYTENLLPSMKDVTADIVGVDEKVYFGTVYPKRIISVSFAFDGLTEAQLFDIKTIWGDKGIHDLIFDERPYKIYSAKLTDTIVTKSLCFTEKGVDIFKGEGSLQFTCFFPFARSRYAWQEDYNLDNIPEWRADEEFYNELTQRAAGNLYYDFDITQDAVGAVQGREQEFEWVNPQSLLIPDGIKEDNVTDNGGLIFIHYSDSNYINYNDWIVSSRIPSHEDYGIYDDTTHEITLFNAGDIPMPTQWWYKIPQQGTMSLIQIASAGAGNLEITNLQRSTIESPTKAGGDRYILIDMPNATIEGYDEYMRPTGRLYNEYISNGDFFLIPVGEYTIEATPKPYNIKFNYLYL